MSKMTKLSATLLAALAFSSAQANNPCAVTDTFANAVACATGGSGNDSVADAWSLITANGWDVMYGFNNPVTQYKDDNVLSTDVPASTTTLFDAVRSGSDDSMGTLSFSMSLNGPLLLALKAGNGWAGYLFTSNFAAGDTITFDIPGQQGRGLSHASIYTSNLPFTTPVPEPSAYAMMIAGLGVLGFAARRRKR